MSEVGYMAHWQKMLHTTGLDAFVIVVPISTLQFHIKIIIKRFYDGKATNHN